ncbi:MAG TPA: hypothetical protein VFJ82_14100 [Longimicrobium sp.]|nr:hypothetical protein [Longimicrobium sp.]
MLALAASVLFAAGCGAPGGGQGAMRDEQAWPVRNPAVALVQGTVRARDGQPLPDVAVEVTALFTDTPGSARIGECAGTPGPVERTRTDAAGEFRVTLSAGAGPQRNACLAVRVEPPAASGLAARTVSGRAAVLRATAAPQEPVRVDVVLSP